MNDVEEWRPWRDGTYEVSSHGRVRRVKHASGTTPMRVLNPTVGPHGYLQFGASIGGKPKTTLVHHAVQEAFAGPTPAGHNINHIDGNKKNNRIDNLEFVTFSQNSRHAARLGLMRTGEAHPFATRGDALIRCMRLAHKHGATAAEIAKATSETKAYVISVISNKTRIHQ